MSEIKLLPCPFCGGEATPVYCENGNRYTSNILYLSKRGTIKCKKCNLTLPRVYSKVSKAIEAWNTRKPMERIVERLEEVGNLEMMLHGGRCNGKTLTLGYKKGIENAIAIVKEEGGL